MGSHDESERERSLDRLLAQAMPSPEAASPAVRARVLAATHPPLRRVAGIGLVAAAAAMVLIGVRLRPHPLHPPVDDEAAAMSAMLIDDDDADDDDDETALYDVAAAAAAAG